MKILLLSCSTGEGHNHCALAVKEALDARGHETSFLDMLHMFGDPGPLSFDKILNRISTKAPDVFGMMYHAGAMYSATGVTSPVYMANIRHARQLNAFIRDNGYDAVVCSHLFPMGNAYVPAPVGALRREMLRHPLGLYVYPVSRRDRPRRLLSAAQRGAGAVHSGRDAGRKTHRVRHAGGGALSRADGQGRRARSAGAVGRQEDLSHHDRGIGCGDAVSLCDAIRRVPDENALLCVLPGRNEALRQALEDAYHGRVC